MLPYLMKTIICLFTTTVVMADAPGKKREGGSKRKGNFDGVNRKRAAIAAAHTAATTTADIAAAASTAAADTAAADANASTIRDFGGTLAGGRGGSRGYNCRSARVQQSYSCFT